MKNFLAVYLGTPNSPKMAQWKALDETQRKEREKAGLAAWHGWMAKNKAAVVHDGAPLGKTKRVSKDGITDTSNNLAGYVVVRAQSHAAAAQLFEHHPHFTLFPGEAIEIMECLPIPGQ